MNTISCQIRDAALRADHLARTESRAAFVLIALIIGLALILIISISSGIAIECQPVDGFECGTKSQVTTGVN